MAYRSERDPLFCPVPARSYIIKQLSRSERQSFLEFAPDYFRYVATMLHRGQETCLAKILGVYQAGPRRWCCLAVCR